MNHERSWARVARALALAGGATAVAGTAAGAVHTARAPESAVTHAKQQADAGASTPTGCADGVPAEGSACTAGERCQVGVGPQLVSCHCVVNHGRAGWSCPNRAMPRLPPGVRSGPLAPPELLA